VASPKLIEPTIACRPQVRTGDILREEDDQRFCYVGRSTATFKVSGVRSTRRHRTRHISTGCVQRRYGAAYPAAASGMCRWAGGGLVVMKPADASGISTWTSSPTGCTPISNIPRLRQVEEIPIEHRRKARPTGGQALLPPRSPVIPGDGRFKPIKWCGVIGARSGASNV